MNKIEALRIEVLELNDQERATLASELLCSLPATLQDSDDGLAEALRRDRELSTSDSYGVTWDELKDSVGH